MSLPVKNESKKLQAALTGKNTYDSRELENIFGKRIKQCIVFKLTYLDKTTS